MAEAVREEIDIVVRSDGMDEGRRRSDAFGTSLDRLSVSQDKATASSDRSAAATERAARAKASAEAAEARMQRQLEAANRLYALQEAAMNQAAAAAGGLTAAQQRAAQTSAAVQKASNDNVDALEKEGSAYKSAAKFALDHPTAIAAGTVLASRALSGLATTAASSLGAASAATAAYAATSTEMGSSARSAAMLAAQGLGLASTAAASAAGGFSTVAEKAQTVTTKLGLLSTATNFALGLLRSLPPIAIAGAVAFAAYEGVSAILGKATADYEKLIEVGKRAQTLDVSAPFLKSFEMVGEIIQAETGEMEKALQRASSFLKDRFGETNGLTKLIGEINATGVAGASGLKATTQADLAGNIEERTKAALAAMKELDELGLHLVSLKIGDAVFGNDLMERLRTGQTTIAQFTADLQRASENQILRQEDVQRALDLEHNIAEVKRQISDALESTISFSSVTMLVNEAWLKILQAVLFVVNAVNDGITAVSNFGAEVATSIGGAFDAAREKAAGLLAQLGIIAKQQAAAEVYGPPEAQGPQEPKITARQFPYVFGPEMPKQAQAAAGAAKQAGQAAQAAVSSYDNLIQRTKDRIDELDLETRSVGQSSEAVIKLKLAHDLERAAKKDGITITEQMRAEYDKLGTTLATSTENLAQAKRQLEVTKEAQRELGSDFATFFDDVLLGGKKIGEAFSGLAKTLASGSLKALLTGEGGMAGLFGTAPEKSGDLGGIFGKLLGGSGSLGNFSSLFGGSSGSLQGPTLSGRTLDVDRITDALDSGASSGIGKALSEALKPQKANGGFLSSPLGGGLAAAAAGGSIGYSTASPTVGAMGGEIAGFSTSDELEMAA